VTKDYTPLQPTLLAHTFHARSVGPVLAVTVSGRSGFEELVRFTGMPWGSRESTRIIAAQADPDRAEV
jgi:hypothetical protein